MEHIAIDLGGRKSRICVRDSAGAILEERWCLTAQLGEYLTRRPKSRVVLETSAEAFAVADTASELGHEVRVVPATLVKSLGVGARGVKTDKKDAQVLSEVSSRIELPSVHIPSAISRDWKALCGMRECMVNGRTKMINNVRGWLRTKVKHVRKGATRTFPQRVEEKLLADAEGIPMYVERELRCIQELNQQIVAADQEIAEIAAQDPRCQSLMTVPGVGSIISVRFVAVLDEVSRFQGAHAVQSYLGLTPGEDSSSARERKTSITKAGSSAMRWLLVQAAWCALRTRPDDPMVRWAHQIAKRRGNQVAAVALARKLAGILYAIWRDGTRYDSKRGADALNLTAEEEVS